MITPDSINSLNNASDNKNYEYKFKRNGSIIQKPTDVGYSYATIKQNPALKGLEGVDDYSGFTTKGKRNNLIYKFDQPSNISNFNFADNPNKEKRACKRAEKGNKRRGTAFTVNDDKVADELYRAVAGNSNVEYGKIRYHKDGVAETTNYIKTDKSKNGVSVPIDPFFGDKNQVVEMTHSHPVDIKGINYNSKYPSDKDKKGYIDILQVVNHNRRKDWNQPMPKHSIYHPITPDKDIMPYSIEYKFDKPIKHINGNGVELSDKEIKDNETLYQDQYLHNK